MHVGKGKWQGRPKVLEKESGRGNGRKGREAGGKGNGNGTVKVKGKRKKTWRDKRWKKENEEVEKGKKRWGPFCMMQ